VWLAVASEEAERAQRLLNDHWERDLAEEERRAANAVVDLDQDILVCPACGASFAHGPPGCPECGLNLGL
jgi:rubrerythrin